MILMGPLEGGDHGSDGVSHLVACVARNDPAEIEKSTAQFSQSHKNPVSASAMLTGKFLQIRKVFATSSLLAEEFPDTLQYKISR